MNKKLLSVAIATATAAAMATPMTAQAVKYKISGQVNRAIVFMDDGQQSDVRNVDSSASGSRFRFRGSEELGNGMKVGMYYEMQLASIPSSGERPDMDEPRNSDGVGIRQANVWFSGNWGKLTVGQGDGAGNGATEADLSGTSIATAPARNSYTGGMRWRTNTAGGAPLMVGGKVLTEGQTYNSFDGFSRYDNVRYDTPSLGPVKLAVSFGNDQLWEIAGRANTALGGGQLSAGLFYSQDTGVSNVNGRYGGSLAYLFSQGTNLSGHYSLNESEKAGTNDGSSWHIKLGHKWGANAAAVTYWQGDDTNGIVGAPKGFEDQGIGVGFVHSLKKANTQLYASFFHNELDTPTGVASVQDHNAFVVGARVKFD